MNSSGSGQGQVTGCCEHGDEPSHSINGVEFLSNVCDCFSRTLSPYSRLAASYSYKSKHVSSTQRISFTKYSAYIKVMKMSMSSAGRLVLGMGRGRDVECAQHFRIKKNSKACYKTRV